jgi:hypothetical protein
MGEGMMKRYLSMLSIGGGTVMTMALWAGSDDPLPAPRAMPKLKLSPSGASPSDAAKPNEKMKSEGAAKSSVGVGSLSSSFDAPLLPSLEEKPKGPKPA